PVMPTLQDLTAKYHQSSTKTSNNISQVLKLQGFNPLIASTVSKAPVNLDITQKSPSEVEIKQTTTASIPAITEQWTHDWEWREFKDSFLGRVRSRSRWTKAGEVEEGFLQERLEKGAEVVEAEVENVEGKWVARQVWGFEGGDFVRRVVTSNKEGERVETRLVYEVQT
ncbi:hypothetical protein DOTSEDRAFT_129278, partial [Dothistroma septosporum NZE10]